MTKRGPPSLLRFKRRGGPQKKRRHKSTRRRNIYIKVIEIRMISKKNII
jgi:hypothetical protein